MPQRIISLVPSQTELLFYLGLGECVVGVTKFCTHPRNAKKQTTIIGGTKTLDIERIIALKPDLIIGNIEENERTQIEQLMLTQNVVMSDIYTFDDALEMIKNIGRLTNTTPQTNAMVAEIGQRFDVLRLKIKPSKPLKIAYFIWRKPYMIAAKNTYIDAMLAQIGGVNAFSNHERYPIVTPEMIAEAQPDYIFLSSVPFPF